MVFYNNSSRIFYAIKRAIRSFFYALFSKRLLFMIIIALFIMLLHLNVNAVSIHEDGFVYRNIISPYYDSENDCYILDYRCYNSTGEHIHSLKISPQIYNLSSWVLIQTTYDDTIKLVTPKTPKTNPVLNINGSYLSYTSSKISIYEYDFTTESFVYWTDYERVNFGNMAREPNCFVYNKNTSIVFNEGNNVGVELLQDNQYLQTANIKYLTDTGFRLYLNDFHGSTLVANRYESSNALTNLYLTVYDVSNHIERITKYNVLSYDDVSQDDNGYYYIDLLFSDLLSFMNVGDGDYVMFFTFELTNSKYCYDFDNANNMNYFTYITVYPDFSYWRFKHFSNSNTGLLIAVDSNGDDLDNQSSVIIDDNQNNNNNENDITNVINNQTTIIQEQTNTINDMSNFMQDDSYSSDSITDNMPNNDEFQDVTENGFDNIFTTLRNAFTSDNYQDVVFTVPFSNGQTITLPSNLTENIIPTAIKALIQMVYWYFIARFIVKDIASYIEKAKSGDIFTSSDTNIKTDML